MSEALSNEKLKEIGQDLLNFTDDKIESLSSWIANFPKGAKAPRGMIKEKSHLDMLRRCVETYKEYGFISDNISAVMSYYTVDSINNIVDKFAKPEKTTTLKFGRVTFHNESAMSEERFKDAASSLFNIMKSFKGYHRLATEKPLDVKFKSSAEMKSKAVYKSMEDEVWIKESQTRNLSEEYAYLPYILVHELGHRVEHLNGIPSGFNDSQFLTTNYSKVDSLAGSEAFAECFALSHWKEKYPQYEEKLTKFDVLMNSEFNPNSSLNS